MRTDAAGRVELFDMPISDLNARRASRGGKGNLVNSSVSTPERSKNSECVLIADDDDGAVRNFDWHEGTYVADSTIDEGKA